jgi:hypothetical protein
VRNPERTIRILVTVHTRGDCDFYIVRSGSLFCAAAAAALAAVPVAEDALAFIPAGKAPKPIEAIRAESAKKFFIFLTSCSLFLGFDPSTESFRVLPEL